MDGWFGPSEWLRGAMIPLTVLEEVAAERTTETEGEESGLIVVHRSVSG